MSVRATKVELSKVKLPSFGVPRVQPEVSGAEYEARLVEARQRAARAKLDFLLVYGDREHFGNITYLCGYDPRFEEGLLILPTDKAKPPVLVVGNEGMGYSELLPVQAERRLFQGFSLLGQKRDVALRIEPIFRDAGITRGSRVGVAGWKYAGASESDEPETWLEVPAYLVDTLRELTGKKSLVTNATPLFMNPADGLRTTNSADQLAAFEFAATHASEGLLRMLRKLRPGMTEFEAVAAMELNGLPWSCHAMLSAGPRARIGLPSPSGRKIGRGEPFTTAVGLWGSLVCRAGFVAKDAKELGDLGERYLERMVKPYFATVVAWYRTLGIGVTGGQLHQAVQNALAPSGLQLTLNPGHLIHLDEWLHSHVEAGSRVPFRSGMLIQADMIPVVPAGLFGTNIEDTVALADATLRKEIAKKYPEMWKRIQARRDFMSSSLGIKLKPELLPFSNTAAALPPFLLRPDHVMTVA